MKEFLLGLYIEYGARAFSYEYKNGEYSRLFVIAIGLPSPFIERVDTDDFPMFIPYKLTAKALEYIKTNDRRTIST